MNLPKIKTAQEWCLGHIPICSTRRYLSNSVDHCFVIYYKDWFYIATIWRSDCEQYWHDRYFHQTKSYDELLQYIKENRHITEKRIRDEL